MISVLAVSHTGVVKVRHGTGVRNENMNPLQAIAFTLRSFIQSRALQRTEDSGDRKSGAWMLPEDERYADEVGELIDQDLMDVRIDSKRRMLVFNKEVRLDLHHSLKRLQGIHPEIDPQVMESELLYWVEQNSEPEGDGLGFTQEQMDKHNLVTENWFDDYYKKVAERPKLKENS